MWDDSKYGKVVYDEWAEKDDHLYGMRYHDGNSSGMKHGVVRTEYKNGSVEESTWFGAKEQDQKVGRHGLRRLVTQ